MFTGIIENTGVISSVISNGSNKTFWIDTPLSDELKIDQSLSHNGVCLTIEALKPGSHQVTAIAETLSKTNMGSWEKGQQVNLERCMQLNGRLDGHIVQGHVDTTATCTAINAKEGSWEFDFVFDPAFAALVIEKGSICVNGTSLTCFNVGANCFTVAIIPYTYEHTNIHQLKVADKVNLEFDIIGKYIARKTELQSSF